MNQLLKEFKLNLENLKEKYENKVNRRTLSLESNKDEDIKLLERINEIIYRISLPLDYDIKNLEDEYEKDLKNYKEKYQLISENANDLIAILNEKFEYEYISEKVLMNLLGFSYNKFLGKTPMDFTHPDDIQNAFKSMEKCTEIGEFKEELRFRRKDGSYIWFDNKGKLFINKAGVKKIIISSREIIERKIAKEKLHNFVKKFKTIFEASSDIFFLVSKDTTILSDRGKKENHYVPPEIILGNKMKDLLPEIAKFSANAIKKTLKTQQPIITEYSLPIDGKTRYFEVRHLYFSEDRATVFIREITERVKATQKLKESEEKYRFFFENSPNAILLINHNGIIVDCNHAAEKMFSCKSNEIIGKYYRNLRIFTPDQISIFIDRYKKLQKGIKLKPIELQIKKKDGNLIWLNCQNSIIRLDNETLIEAIGQDITEKKEVERLIVEEYKKLKELDQIRKDFITRTSHELKTPLTSICGATDLLLQYYKDILDYRAFKLIEIISKGGKRLKTLIENLLDVSRLESNKFELKTEKENIISIIIECISDMFFFADERDLLVNFNFHEDIYMDINRIRIEQVFMNLLSNSIKNTPPKGTISIEIEKYGDYVEIRFKDTGVGFTTEEKTRIFKKFGKIERYGKRMDVISEGTGLGLYISKKIVELHRGKIYMKSEGRNKGSIFIIRLPINQEN